MLIIDFTGKKIGEVVVNGKPAQGLVQFDNSQIKVKKSGLETG